MIFRSDAVHASLALRYHNPRWDLAKNKAIYGNDHGIEGLGANVTVWLEVVSELDPVTKLVIPEKGLASFLAEAKELLDHRCLFEVEPWFQERVPTLENICRFLTEKIWIKEPPRGHWHRLVVEESRAWKFEIRKDGSSYLTHTFGCGEWTFEATLAAEIDSVSGLSFERAKILGAVAEWKKRAVVNKPPATLYVEMRDLFPTLRRLKAYAEPAIGWELRS